MIPAVADEFVILDQPVVGVFRKGQGREVEGVDDRQTEDVQVRPDGRQNRQVVGKEVVAQNERGVPPEPVEIRQGRPDVEPVFPLESLVPQDRANGEDPAVGGGFQVDQEAVFHEGAGDLPGVHSRRIDMEDVGAFAAADPDAGTGYPVGVEAEAGAACGAGDVHSAECTLGGG